MGKSVADISLRKTAIVAGGGLFLMTLFFFFADIFVFQKLIVSGDAPATVKNIVGNELLFRAGICSFLIVIILDVVVAWALYVFLKPANSSLSLLAAWFRLVYSTIFVIALANYYSIFQLLSGSEYLKVFEAAELQAQVMLNINAFNDVWAIGLVFFGLHLTVLGSVALKADYVPVIMSILLILAGVSYLVDKFAVFLFPGFDISISIVLGFGELLFMFWLLLKGGNPPVEG